jgi:predicted nucleotidyltransferase
MRGDVAVDSGRLYDIDEIRRKITPIAQKYGVLKLSVFGSYARGDATEISDLDFHIIDRGSLRGLIRLASFELALEEMFNIPVDVVTSESLFEDIREKIEREEMIVYDVS